MSEALFAALEKAFGCHIYGVKPRRNVYLIRTNRGLWVVKGYQDREKAHEVTEIARTLRQHGFTRTVCYVADTEGREVFPFDSRHYTVMKAIEGREAMYSSLYDVKQAASTLAWFHRAARGFPPPFSMYGRIPSLLEKWEHRLAHFEEIVHEIDRRGTHNRFEFLVRTLATEALRDGRELLREAVHLPLVDEIHQSILYGMMAHRDVASHNFLLDEQGRCYLIDLDTVSYDMQLADLVQFFGRMMVMQGYSMDAFVRAIDAYVKVNPLSDAQIFLIHRLLRFPDNILREVTGLYARRPGYRVRGVLQLLQLERRYLQERRRFLEADSSILNGLMWSRHYA